MERYKINILGLSEVRWLEEGEFVSGEIRVIYSGGKERQRGVAVLLDKETYSRVTSLEKV